MILTVPGGKHTAAYVTKQHVHVAYIAYPRTRHTLTTFRSTLPHTAIHRLQHIAALYTEHIPSVAHCSTPHLLYSL